MVIFPDENTIAFGGVLMGIMNAQLAASVKGIQKVKIGCPISRENKATIGTNIETKAKFDISSVAKIEIEITISRR